MAREGMLPTDLHRILPLLTHDAIIVEGVATHFNMVPQDREIQKSRFDDALQVLANNGVRPRIVHAVGSHNGICYNHFNGSFSLNDAKLDVFYTAHHVCRFTAGEECTVCVPQTKIAARSH